MAEDKTPQGTPAAEPVPAAEPRPEPPPYQPDRELIGYIERGQKPPTSAPVRPPEEP